jgi:hypothetical protein
MVHFSDASPNLETCTQRLRQMIGQMVLAETDAESISIEYQIVMLVAEIASTPANGLTDCILKARALGDLGELHLTIGGKVLPCATELADSLANDLHELPGSQSQVESQNR